MRAYSFPNTFFNWNHFKISAQNMWLFIEVLKYLVPQYKSNFVFYLNTQLAFFSYEKMNHQQLTGRISNGHILRTASAIWKLVYDHLANFIFGRETQLF